MSDQNSARVASEFNTGIAIEITVRTLGGKSLAVLHSMPEMTVLELKERLARISGALVAQQKLAYGNSELRDCDTLRVYGISAPAATLQYVRVKPSGMAQLFQEQHECSNDPSEVVESSLVDIVDSVMQSEHRLSERWKPQAEELTRAMSFLRRAELISWMVQAFDAFQFDDCILHGAVATLDRYYARQQTPIENNALQKVVLGAVCTELKLAEDRPGHWQRVVGHLCQNRVSLSSVLRTETQILSKLGFVVGIPTPVTFLRGLSLRLRGGDAEVQIALQLARFLLDLAVFDPVLQYGQSNVVLAAAALSAGFRVVGAPRERREELIEDVFAYDSSLIAAEKHIIECEGTLLRFWLACSEGTSEGADFGFRYLRTKYEQELGCLSPAKALGSLREDCGCDCDSGSCPPRLATGCGLATDSFVDWGMAAIACA